MFSKILIANRGEIACRIARTAAQLGIRTVAVYSDADANALHVRLADEAVHIGGSAPRDSYLAIERIVAAAEATGAEAIHPGYGFLSENAEFASACAGAGIEFVGPPVAAIEAMGSKSRAKSIMEDAGVPLVPGYHGQDQDDGVLRDAAAEIGYPVLLKAVAGGGGKGMRVVDTEAAFDEALASARREARSSFGDDDMLVEKFLRAPRHVELQIFLDKAGNAVHLFERDCSVQRRHQKVIEEAPAPGLDEAVRQAMGEAAISAARAIDYVGAGTVEFLFDGDGGFYFMEMNTRLQVEHPVTELITGQDLVEWQLRVASGEPLPCTQDELAIDGHAFEARIYAEDPAGGFLPATGTLTYLRPPETSEHVRVDSGVVQGDEISVYYDPMIAKLITWDENRDRALARLAKALSEYRISGLANNVEFLYNIATSAPFRAAELNTGFIERHSDTLMRFGRADVEKLLPLASLYLLLRREQLAEHRAGPGEPSSPWNAPSAWRLNAASLNAGSIIMAGESYDVPAVQTGLGAERRFLITAAGRSVSAHGELSGATLSAVIDGHRSTVTVVANGDSFTLFTGQRAVNFELPKPDLGESVSGGGEDVLRAPMNGTLIRLSVAAGDAVRSGQKLAALEAMKMEHPITAPRDGVIASVRHAEGDLVSGGDELARLEPI